MNMKRIFVVLLTVCLMVNFVFTQALAYEEGLFVSLDGDWRSVTFGPAGVDQGYGYLLANPDQVITVTPQGWQHNPES